MNADLVEGVIASLDKSDLSAVTTLEQLKKLARQLESVKKETCRSQLWRCALHLSLPEVDLNSNVCVYKDTIDTLYKHHDILKEVPLPALTSVSLINYYNLNAKGRAKVTRIVGCIAYNAPDVEECGPVVPIVSILLHYLSESECYCYAQYLLASKNPIFLSRSERENLQETEVMLYFQEQYNKKYVKRLKALAGEGILQESIGDWSKWLFIGLPLPHLMTMMDSFLVEGRKILFRVCIALLRYFIKLLLNDANYQSKLSQSDQNLTSILLEFCASSHLPSPQLLMAKAFRLKAFRKSDIAKRLKKSTGLTVQRSRSVDQLQQNMVIVAGLQSETMRTKQLSLLWSHLPIRMRDVQPCLAFSSNKHGLSINTFYSLIENYEPTVVIIKTTTNHVLGAYCSTRWSDRKKGRDGKSSMYFGTGETFVFRVNEENVEVYEWIGKKVKNVENEEKRQKERHEDELFVSAQPDMFVIGGGGGSAIQVSSDLISGCSEPCSTFDNPCLIDGDNKQFEVAILEVIGLNRIED